MDHRHFDYVVVGAGMVGSSAAKYIAQRSGDLERNINVAIIGVEEPGEEEPLYGAWHDEGRITRLLDKSDCWGELAERSLLRYREIEEASGVAFYQEVGFLSLIDDKYQDTEKLRQASEKLHSLGYKCEDIVDNTRFPDLNISSPVFGYFQPDHSGYINPRKLVEAQLRLAERAGCRVIRSGVDAIKGGPDSVTGEYKLSLRSGESILATNVLIATGAYINISGILREFTESDVDLTLTTQTVAFIRISDSEATRLNNMPAVVTSYQSGSLDGTYILPPILYPDGHHYLKLGHHDHFERTIETLEELEDWYRAGGGDEEAVQELTSFITSFVPGLQIEEDKTAPYIDRLQAGLWLAAGGCGYAAKSCDEIGNLAGNLILTGAWESHLDRELFRVKFK